MKGITLNYENLNDVKFTVLRRMILEDETRMHMHKSKKMLTKHGCASLPEPERKE
jgi:hypothetical protein